MAFKKNVVYKGQEKTDVLSGKVRLEAGNNRIVVVDETGKIRIIIGYDKDGF